MLTGLRWWPALRLFMVLVLPQHEGPQVQFQKVEHQVVSLFLTNPFIQPLQEHALAHVVEQQLAEPLATSQRQTNQFMDQMHRHLVVLQRQDIQLVLLKEPQTQPQSEKRWD